MSIPSWAGAGSELGIGLVPLSPQGRCFLTARSPSRTNFLVMTSGNSNPYQPVVNRKANAPIVEAVRTITAQKG